MKYDKIQIKGDNTLEKKYLITQPPILLTDFIKDIKLQISLDRKLSGKIKDMVLFGSYARNEAHEYSDLDILVILDDERSSYWMMKDFLEIDEYVMNKYGILINFIPYTLENYNNPVNYNLMKNIWEDGVEIWD